MSNPLENPLVRHAIGLSGAAMIVIVAVLFVDGPIRWALLGFAVVDAVLTPKFLEYAAESESATDDADAAR